MNAEILQGASQLGVIRRTNMGRRNYGNWGSAMMAVVVISVAILVLGQSQVAEAKYKGVNQFCRTSFWRRLCTRQVKGATNYHDAVKNAIDSTIQFNGVVQKMLPVVISALNELPEFSRDSAVKTCQENFEDLADNLKESLTYLATNDTGSMTSHLSAATTVDCEEAFTGFNLDFPPQVSKILKILHDQIDNCLAVILQT